MFNKFRTKQGKKSTGQASVSTELDLKDLLTSDALFAASQVAPVAPPKVPNKQTSYPNFWSSIKAVKTVMSRTDRRIANKDITSLRTTSQETNRLLRELTAVHPDLSSSKDAYLRTAITKKYTAVAYRFEDSTVDVEATKVLQQILVRFDTLQDYQNGFDSAPSLRSVSETLGEELRLDGACAVELVLDKNRLPYRLQPVSVPSIVFYQDGLTVKPKQLIGDKEIDLDIPTFFYVSLDQRLDTTYSASPMEAAIQPTLFAQEFMNDLRQVVRRAIHPRIRVSLDTDAVRAGIPPEFLGIQEDGRDGFSKYMDGLSAHMNDVIGRLEPDDALVVSDTATVDYMTGGNTSLDAEYKVLQGIMDSKMATGAKVLPSILGHSAGSANIASTESLLFLKNAEGAVQCKLNELYSKVLTLAVRLYGFDVYVKFNYAEIDLRPESELVAFRAMRQAMVLEQLSLGLITDEEASLELVNRLPHAGAPRLSGTNFKNTGTADVNGNANMYSNTSTGGGGGALNQATKPTTPQQTKT